jgi:hypothetical protein
LYASPDVVEKAARELIDLVAKRDQQWQLMDDCGISTQSPDRKAVERMHLTSVMGQLVQIGAIARAWMDEGSMILEPAGIKNAIVGECLYKGEQNQKVLKYRTACNCLVHASSMWLKLDANGCCKGSGVEMVVPAYGRKPDRLVTICLMKFATTTLTMLDTCRDCTGSINEQLLVDGLPIEYTDMFNTRCSESDSNILTVVVY